ncbi:MAG: DUF4238 domain-containing protein, partial [Methylococcales bacterium]|nr:DUF4238 domain-containing protein [Methylococcales bacterium]
MESGRDECKVCDLKFRLREIFIKKDLNAETLNLNLVQDITMNQLHVKNHFVPQSYLKRWENPSHKVCVYKTLVSHANIPIWKSFFTAAVGYHRHLYTQVLNGEESDNLENWFSQEFESPASEVI